MDIANSDNEMSFRIMVASEAEFLWRGRIPAQQRSADRGREHVVWIEVQLAKEANAGPAGVVDREYRLGADLEICAHPDHARIDRSDGDGAVAEIVGDGRRELHLNNRKQVIDEIGQLVIVNF